MARGKKNIQGYSELRITGVPPKLKEEIENISLNTGIDMSAWCKSKLRESVDAMPADKKLPPKFD